MAGASIRVVVADDHQLVRSGICALLDRLDDVEVVGEAADGEELLARVESTAPDVVITDISMPGVDGIEAIGHIARRHPGIRVIVLSMHDNADFVKRALANGACAYVMKNASGQVLGEALRSVVSTGSYFDADVARQLARSPSAFAEDELTFRQIEIVKMLAEGKSSKEIAYELDLSPKTIDMHRARIMLRLQLNDIASLTRYAMRKGLVKL